MRIRNTVLGTWGHFWSRSRLFFPVPASAKKSGPGSTTLHVTCNWDGKVIQYIPYSVVYRFWMRRPFLLTIQLSWVGVWLPGEDSWLWFVQWTSPGIKVFIVRDKKVQSPRSFSLVRYRTVRFKWANSFLDRSCDYVFFSVEFKIMIIIFAYISSCYLCNISKFTNVQQILLNKLFVKIKV